MFQLSSEYLFVPCIGLYVLVMSRTCFRVNPHYIVAWMSRNALLEFCRIYEAEGIGTGFEPTSTSLVNKHSTIWPSWANDWAELWVLISTVHLTKCSCHVTDAFENESTLYSCLNVKKLLLRNRYNTRTLSDYNWNRTNNQLDPKGTSNHLVKLTKRLSSFVSSYLYGAFNCMFLSCHIRVAEWLDTI